MTERTSSFVELEPTAGSDPAIAGGGGDRTRDAKVGGSTAPQVACWPWLALVTVVGGLVRLTVVIGGRDRPPSADGFVYSYIGDRLAEGGGYRSPSGAETALHPPAWSFVLGIGSRLGADGLYAHQIIAALIGTVTVLAIGLVGRRAFGRRVGLIAAAIAAVIPHLWLWERELAAITLVMPLLAAGAILTYEWIERPRAWTPVALGFVCGAVVLTRTEQLVAMVGFILVGTIAARRPWRSQVVPVAVVVLVAAAMAAPWLISNQRRFAEPVYLATGSGVTLAYANNDRTYSGSLIGYGDSNVWKQSYFVQGDESVLDRHFREVGLDYVRDNTERVPIVVAARHARTWGLLNPGQQVELDNEWGHSDHSWYWAGYWAGWATVLLAVWGTVVARRRGLRLAPLVVTLVVVVFNVTATYGQTRYRVPALVLLVPLAALAIDDVLLRRRRRLEPGST